jgi:hypothetical protein
MACGILGMADVCWSAEIKLAAGRKEKARREGDLAGLSI